MLISLSSALLPDTGVRRGDMNDKGQFESFDAAMRKVLGVSREELKRREEEWKREHPQTGKKRGRKSKTSSSGRASGGKGN